MLDRQAAAEFDRRARIENVWLRRPMIVISVILLLSGLAIIPARSVRFDYNLLHMQSAGLPAVIFQDKLIQSSTNRSVLFAAVVADSLSQATNLIAHMTNLPSVASVESMADYLTEDQTRKLALLAEIKKVASEIRFEPIDSRPVNLTELDRSLYSLHGYCSVAANEVKDDPVLRKELLGLRKAVSGLRSRMLLSDPAMASHQLAEFQQALFNDVRDTFQSIRNQNDQERLKDADLPPALRHRFIGITGKYLIQVYPKKDIWNRKEQEEFIRELRNLKPDVGSEPIVTGTPVQLYEYTTLLKNSYETAAWYSLAAIAILVFIHFRSLNAVILSLLPVGIGTLWLVGLMGWLKIPFNPANIMTLPLVIGIGVTNGIHILNRFAEERTPGILSRSTGKAVLVSGLTAIAGFGSLMLAKHQGIYSLGCVMASGIATCMIAGLAFLPALLSLLGRMKPLIEKPDVSRTSPTPGREEPR